MFSGGGFNAFMLALRGVLSNSIPLAATAAGAAGTSQNVAREGHVHILSGVRQAYDQDNSARILISSGNVNESGLFTGLTALPTTPIGVVYVYLGDTTIGLAAGLYLAVFSSTTSCQLVGSPVTTAKAYTAPTSECVLASTVVTGGHMGLHGMFSSTHPFSCLSSGNNKTQKVKFGSTTIHNFVCTTTNLNNNDTRVVRNRGSASVQWSLSNNAMLGGYGGTTNSPVLSAENTAANVTVQYTAQLANAADWMVFSGYTIDIVRSPRG